ncbi:MAG: hypothetical protein D6767_03690 [Candidatus Hydrogenedentota bacterium]|nr:MAG: hypothetical protein D6767_03690 [Candidatus Hydrogenedentota bacterium]
MKLVIDTSFSLAFVGTTENYLYKEIPRQNDAWLFQMMREAISSENYLNNITEIYLGKGPGSFTGLRVSFTFAKTLACLKEIAIYTFPSLQSWHQAYELKEKTMLWQMNRSMIYGYVPHLTNPVIAFRSEEIETIFEKYRIREYVFMPALTRTPKEFLSKSPLLTQNWIIECPKKPLKPISSHGPIPWDKLKPVYGHKLDFELRF